MDRHKILDIDGARISVDLGHTRHRLGLVSVWDASTHHYLDPAAARALAAALLEAAELATEREDGAE